MLDLKKGFQKEKDYCSFLVVDLQQVSYLAALDLQKLLVDARKSKQINSNIILFLEHTPVFTLGRRGGKDNLTVSDTFLKDQNIPVVQTERGGNITYHGPGQLVAYLIIDLDHQRLSVEDYVTNLETVMLQTAAEFGIDASQNSKNRGIWVNNKKMGSIGIAIRHGITFHGLALNVNLSLVPFQWINPCGMKDVEMTSLKQELKQELSMESARDILKSKIKHVFGCQFEHSNLAELQKIIGFDLELK